MDKDEEDLIKQALDDLNIALEGLNWEARAKHGPNGDIKFMIVGPEKNVSEAFDTLEDADNHWN